MDENMIYVDCDNGEDAIDCGNVSKSSVTIARMKTAHSYVSPPL